MDFLRELRQCIALHGQGDDKQSQSYRTAQCLLEALVDAINKGKPMSDAMKKAFEKASVAARQFVREHPVLARVFVTIVALGVLALLVPWVIKALGFGILGPVKGKFPLLSVFHSFGARRLRANMSLAGSFAANLQSTFPNVPAGSWFSFFQKLGMKWGSKTWIFPFF